MTQTSTICRQFIDRYGFHADLSLCGELLEKFLEAMKQGFQGHQPESDLAMIPLIFQGERPDTADRNVIVIDVGGTNTRAALIRFDRERKPEICEYYRCPTPGTGVSEPVEIEEFFREIAALAAPVLGKARHMGICFSFANRTLPDGDAVITAGGKQIMVKDFIGSTIGAGLRQAARKLGLPADHHIRIINDTAAVLLGGMALDSRQSYGDYIGLVLGTGLNQAYIEPEESFLRDWSEEGQCGSAAATEARSGDSVCRSAAEATIVVNQECGGFRGIPLNPVDRDFIGLTYDPDIDWTEKLVSGRYFGGIVLHALKEAARQEGCLSEGAALRLGEQEALDTEEVSVFLQSEGAGGLLGRLVGTDDQDRSFALELIDGIMERTAFYVAVCIAGTLRRGRRKDGKPVCIMVEGSLYEKLPGFRQKLESLLSRCLKQEQAGLPEAAAYRFVTAENTTLLGTALAGLWE